MFRLSPKRTDAVSGYPAHDILPKAVRDPAIPFAGSHSFKNQSGKSELLATEVDIQRGSYDEREFVTLKENDPMAPTAKSVAGWY